MPKSGKFHTVQISEQIYSEVIKNMEREMYVGTVTGFIETSLLRQARNKTLNDLFKLVTEIRMAQLKENAG